MSREGLKLDKMDFNLDLVWLTVHKLGDIWVFMWEGHSERKENVENI